MGSAAGATNMWWSAEHPMEMLDEIVDSIVNISTRLTVWEAVVERSNLASFSHDTRHFLGILSRIRDKDFVESAAAKARMQHTARRILDTSQTLARECADLRLLH